MNKFKQDLKHSFPILQTWHNSKSKCLL